MAVQEVTAQAWPPLPVFAITTSDRGARGSALSSSGARVQNVVLADSGLPGSALLGGGFAPPPAAATTADNDASTPLWRSAGLSPEHHLQSIVWLKQVQPNTCGGKRSTARGKKAGTAHCLVKTEPRPGSDGLTQPRLWDRGGENPRKKKN